MATPTHPQAPASPQPEAEAQKEVAGCSHPCGDVACAVVCKEYQAVPWPEITSYAGGQSEDGAYAWVDVQLTDGPETTRFVRAPITQAVKVPLTERQVDALVYANREIDGTTMQFVRAIEAAHGIHPTEGGHHAD